MPDSIIETRRFFKKCTLELLKDEIKVIKSTPFNSVEFEVSYEQIETKKTIETKVNFGLLVLVFLFSFIGILFLFGDRSYISTLFFSFAILVLIFSIITKLKIMTIKSFEGHNLELYFTSRNKQDVLSFADKIINSANNYILNKYSKIDKDLPIENQLAKLSFLQNKDLITDEQFEQLKSQLLGRENKQSIGYR